ncbi:MAG: DUF885 domain-containing protein [Methanobacteriota archaeon]|nr:MAG: DUF885 domain-containing protein [Euryarchaeota archaeon]TLZ66334.1 MAG: DUF885 domain-containing protein [Euryarchaeota archaeon]
MAPGKTRSNFRAVAKRILDDHRSFDPSGSAASGLHRFDGVLPDYSGASVRGYTARARNDLKSLDRIARADSLSRSARLELGVLRGMLLSELSELEDQRLPRAFPFYFLFRLSIVNYLLRNYAPLDRRLRSVGKLQAQVPAFLESLRGTIDRRLADTCYEMAEMAAAGILDAYSRELPEYLRDASPGVRNFVERTNETAKSELKALVNELTTSYKPRIKAEFALGQRKYERMIFAEHLVHIPLDRLSEVGRSDLKANQAAFRETAKEIDSSKRPEQVLEGIERDHPTAQSLIQDTREMLEEIRGYLIDQDIVTVPSEERAKVIETPRFYRFATAAMNPPGSFEKVAKDAYYYVTPTEESWTPEKKEEWLRHLNYTTLRNISVHECYPGHYVHFLHRMRVGSTVLKSYYSYAFTEGWAHYCEAMMVEEGFGDRRLKLAMLQDALLRDCRYLSSIGMHTAGWSWETATRFFMENAYLDRLPAEREAKRGTWDPGYLNYTLGKLMIQKLRSDWKKQHPNERLKEFHDAFLALGAPPLGLAREHLLGPDAGPAL